MEDLGQTLGLTGYQNAVSSWWASVDQAGVMAAAIFLIVVFLFRKRLANLVVGAISKLIANITDTNEGFGVKTTERLEKATRILLVAASALLLVETLALPELFGGVVRRIIVTAAIIAVFTTWYELAGSFVSIFRSGDFQDVPLETDWTAKVTRFAILLFGITAVLEVWDVDISGALTGVGVLGAGFAIAAQDLVRNLIAGMTNQSEERFAKGDAIEVEGGFLGVVQRIDLRSTLVLGFDQVPRHVPNSQLSDSVLKNFSRMRHRRVLVDIPILLSSSLDQIEFVRSQLEDHLRNSGDFSASDDAPKHVHISGITDSAVNITFYALTKTGSYPEFLQVSERLSETILKIVHASGTELAHPTRTVKIRENEQSSHQ